MKTVFRRSCLGVLLILLLGGLAAVTGFAIVFQQSQAQFTPVHSTAIQIPASRPTADPLPIPVNPGGNSGLNDPNAGVTIQVDMPTATPLPTSTVAVSTTTDIPVAASNTSTDGTPADVPRYSGTSSYPLTVTAEVMLAQTHVAGYEAGVSGTRTAIAAESASIYATLTAAAQPTGTP